MSTIEQFEDNEIVPGVFKVLSYSTEEEKKRKVSEKDIYINSRRETEECLMVRR